MRVITAIINPFKLDDVKEALAKAGALGMTVSDVRGFGRQKGHRELYRGSEYTVDFVPKVKVEVLASAEDAGRLADTIASAARTGRIGDGKIFVAEVERCIRIRTGEEGKDAL